MSRVTPGAPGNFSGGGGSSEITDLVGITALGQTTMANSLPVVLASDQSAVSVSQSGTWNIANVSGTVSLPTGASTLAEQQTQTTSLAAIETAVEILDNIVSGSEAQVDVVTLPTRDDEDFDDGAGTDSHQARGLYLQGFATSAVVARDDAGYGENQTVGVLSVHARLWDGSAYDRWPGNSTDGALVNLGSNNDVGLNAGTNNIGDVDVLTVPRSQSGPGQPGTAVDSYTHASINLAAAANQVLVSSAPSKQIWVYGIGFSVNAAGSVSFQDEDDTAITGIMTFAANGGMTSAPSGNFAMPLWKLGTDKDLEVDIVTSELDGWIDYAIISV